MDFRERIKELANENDSKVKDFLALTPQNDPMYIRPAEKEKAQWFKDIWEKEGRPQIHPRGLHYRILGKGYLTRHGDEYENTMKCWNEMLQGAKYARLLGLVPFRSIEDEKNPDPQVTKHQFGHNEFTPRNIPISTDLEGTDTPQMGEPSTPDLIEHCVETVVTKHFTDVDYNIARLQPNYLEVWSEKAAVIPNDICREAGATLRPAGGGEMSLRMCWDSVRKAEKRDKPLHVFLITDFDPKGLDMPKSVARKLELMAKDKDVDAYVHHIAVTKEQCKKYGLPTTPAKNPDGTGTGAKAYRTHTQMFKEHAGQEPTEINSFQGREPEEYRKTIKEALLPFYDPELSEDVREATGEAKDEVREKVREKFEEIQGEVDEVRHQLRPKLEKLEDYKERIGLPSLIEKYEDVLDINTKEIVADVEVDLPEPQAETVGEDPLLDTNREYGEQIRYYKKFDMRYK